MAEGSAIEWTEATWNPTTGCTKISAGCKNCYAEKLSKRLKAMGQAKYRNDFGFTEHEAEVELPLRWKKPRKIFVNSMSDLFHKESGMEFVARCFETMVRADWHTYQVLTKRPGKMARFADVFDGYFGFPIPGHIWMGVSAEDNRAARRIDGLRKARCGVRFVSFEPLLEEIDGVDLAGIDWAIIGGESGPRHRKVEEKWVEGLIEQCERQNVRVFFKQWGGPRPKSNGRTVNGRTYSEYPETPKAAARELPGFDGDRLSKPRPKAGPALGRTIHSGERLKFRVKRCAQDTRCRP